MAESVIGLFRTGVINFPGPSKSMAQVEWETLQWIAWYNAECLHCTIGYITPNEAEDAFHAALNAYDKTA